MQIQHESAPQRSLWICKFICSRRTACVHSMYYLFVPYMSIVNLLAACTMRFTYYTSAGNNVDGSIDKYPKFSTLETKLISNSNIKKQKKRDRLCSVCGRHHQPSSQMETAKVVFGSLLLSAKCNRIAMQRIIVCFSLESRKIQSASAPHIYITVY